MAWMPCRSMRQLTGGLHLGMESRPPVPGQEFGGLVVKDGDHGIRQAGIDQGAPLLFIQGEISGRFGAGLHARQGL